MAIRIDVNVPSFVLEAANAAQAANRNQLQRRENQIKVEKEAARRIKIEEVKIQDRPKKKGKNDPWKGAVPEYDSRLVLPKRRPLTTEFGIIIQEDLLFRNFRSDIVNIGFPGAFAFETRTQISSNLITTPSIKRTKIFAFRHLAGHAFSYWADDNGTQNTRTNTDYGTYLRSEIKSTGGNPYSSILKLSRDSVLFRVQGELGFQASEFILNGRSVTIGSEDILEIQAGIMIPLENLTMPSYIYVYGTDVYYSELYPQSQYPAPDEILGKDFFVDRMTITPERKQLLAKNDFVFQGVEGIDSAGWGSNGLMGHAYFSTTFYGGGGTFDLIYQFIYTNKDYGGNGPDIS
jgi:hypothetical protein